MCGIIGILGAPNAPTAAKHALRLLEYRGYDSCGVAWVDASIERRRAVGAVEQLVIPEVDATVAIGHTRWATHGGVTESNAHPHTDEHQSCAVVHNGVLLNHEQLRRDLEHEGVVFASETDSEILAHLWAKHPDDDAWSRLRHLMDVLSGTFSIAILDQDGSIAIAKHRNPLWITVQDGVTYLASDPIALRRFSTTAIPLEDGDHGVLTADACIIRDANGRDVTRKPVDIQHLDDRVSKAGHEHYMLKEILETPAALNRILAAHLRQVDPYVVGMDPPSRNRIRRMLALGAGTSYHSGLLGAHWFKRIARIPAESRPTPEYKDDLDLPEPYSLLVAMSQSGETLDTLQALHRVQAYPYPSVAITNHPASSIGRMTDLTLPIRTGVEVSVAATKTFLGQSLLLYLMALRLSGQRRVRRDSEMSHAVRELIRLPRAIHRSLHRTEEVQAMARDLSGFDNMFILAKGDLLPVAMEGALKLKEIAYQHAEAYPAGELKHGPFALLTPATPVVFLVGPGRHVQAVLNSLQEVAARGAPTVIIAMEGVDGLEGRDDVLWVPPVWEELAPFVFSSVLHHLSYWVAKARGLPIDKPRNLAKSVTVE